MHKRSAAHAKTFSKNRKFNRFKFNLNIALRGLQVVIFNSVFKYKRSFLN